MKFKLKGKYSALLTFMANSALWSLVWQWLEVSLNGQVIPSTEDTIMLFLFCSLITWNHSENEAIEKKLKESLND